MKAILAFCVLMTFWCTGTLEAQSKRPLPVIDMHVHAMHADDQGPPPMTMKTPFRDFGYHDPKTAYGQTFMGVMKSNAWGDSNKRRRLPTILCSI